MQIKFFKKERDFKKENSHLSINFYWELAVLLMFVAIIISFSFGYYLFRQINDEQIVPQGVASGQETVKKERILKVLEYFSMREQKSNQILNSSSPVIDLSL